MLGKTPEQIIGWPFHDKTADEVAQWQAALVKLLDHDEPRLRVAAVERLTSSMMRWDKDKDEPQQAAEARWLLQQLEKAQSRRSDILPTFLDLLRWHGDSEPFQTVLLEWLHDLHAQYPDLREDQIIGAVILLSGIGMVRPGDVPPYFDHPSDYVRACAAYQLGSQGLTRDEDGNREDIEDPEFMARLTAWEMARPGVAGPWWMGSGGVDHRVQAAIDPVEWMLDIVERRAGPEPHDLPFNGIDFHIHEGACFSPQAVGRMAQIGRLDLAIMTATEMREPVEGMEKVLLELGDVPGVAPEAHRHLAEYYGVVHPKADPRLILQIRNWRPGADVIVTRLETDRGFIDSVSIYAQNGDHFDAAKARSLLDQALPPDLRGPLVSPWGHGDQYFNAEPAIVGDSEIRAFENGGRVTMSGDAGKRQWRRIEISGGRLQGRWNPFEWPEAISARE